MQLTVDYSSTKKISIIVRDADSNYLGAINYTFKHNALRKIKPFIRDEILILLEPIMQNSLLGKSKETILQIIKMYGLILCNC